MIALSVDTDKAITLRKVGLSGRNIGDKRKQSCLHLFFICIATPTTSISLIKDVSAVLRKKILILLYFGKMVQSLISLITYNTILYGYGS